MDILAAATEWQSGPFLISTDRSRLDLDVIHGFLKDAYWCAGIPRDIVERSVDHSLNFGLYEGGAQIGFARVITDYATFAYVGDVFVLPEYRGQGLGIWLMQVVTGHPDLQGLRRWVLLTRDAHTLYRRVGFTDVADARRYMERADPGVYTRNESRGNIKGAHRDAYGN